MGGMQKMRENTGLIGATLLISGCTIGAGMLGLPVVAAAAGFLPSTLAMILAYLFATATGLLLVEAALWFDEKVHLVSLSEDALGKFGKILSWSFFLFLFYCIFVAYIEGGGQIFSSFLGTLLGKNISRELGVFSCVFLVGSLSYFGTKAVSFLSRLFLLGLALSYGSLISLGLSHVEKEQLLYTNWKVSLATIPILFICFGYQNLVPTVIYYAKKNVSVIRKAILIGNFIPFLIYSLWNFVILGILEDPSPEALSKIVNQGDMVTGLLEKASSSESVLFFANVFTFFAIVTPFMTNTIAFVDFFKDGFKKIPKVQIEPLLYALVLVPPALCTLMFPHLFLSALSFAGGFIDAVLFGILPATIVWIGRYKKGQKGPYQFFGGKVSLSLVLLFSSLVLLYRLSRMLNI